MINTIKNKYYSYDPNEFMPIYIEGKIANAGTFHLMKLKKAAIAADKAWMSFVNRAHSI